ncbi:hypothetical protein HMPREF0490_00761 [Lachnospiraceae bacterium 6_1_37FAA]|nr:hypothetical protein HMPREF0490_00761 [Lachnospiraceae bacterium 6_1_37FAA]
MLYSNTQDLLTEIRKKMLDEKINIKELANRMNKSPSAVSMAFKQKNISIESLNDICQAMNLNIDINFIKKDDTN